MTIEGLMPPLIVTIILAYTLSVVVCIYFMQNGFKKLKPEDDLYKEIIRTRWVTYSLAFVPGLNSAYALIAMIAFAMGFIKKKAKN